jgi:hypothetical protein
MGYLESELTTLYTKVPSCAQAGRALGTVDATLGGARPAVTEFLAALRATGLKSGPAPNGGKHLL